MKKVVIIGGGFAGLNCAVNLASDRSIQITLIDRHNYNQFQPLLYQVAAGLLAPSNVSFSLRNILIRHPNIEVKMADIISVDLPSRTAISAQGQRYSGDYLVLAAGSQANFFGARGAEENTYPLYSLRDAELLRSRILGVLEAADRDPSLMAKGALNFVIVGGGPTGVEMAGVLGDLLHHTLLKEYPRLPLTEAQIILVDLVATVLNAFSARTQSYAARKLEERGVQLRLQTTVQEVGPGHVLLSDGSRIETRTVIWAGGLKASSLSSHIGTKTGPGGRVPVQPDLTLESHPHVYALGDFASAMGKNGRPLPQLASVANQAGAWAARNIAAHIAGKPTRPFSYFDKGIMAIIGRGAAVAEIGPGRRAIRGFLAFASWLIVHASLLYTARARIQTVVEWAWDYFSKIHGNRVLDRLSQGRIDWNLEARKASSTETVAAAHRVEDRISP